MDKPKYLYHASQNRNIEILEPKANKVRDQKEGPVVFASESPARVSKFLIPLNDSISQLSRWGNLDTAIYADREAFYANDKGGAIYKLPSDSFYLDPKYTHTTDEWTSKVPVKPISKEVFESGYDAMTKFGIKIYFVDQEMLSRIRKADDHGFSIIIKLKPDNQK